MIRAGVVGATGYAGAELVKILFEHPDVDLSVLVSRQYAGSSFDKVYPALTGVIPNVCEALSVPDICNKADVLFLALPHKIPMSIVPELMARGKKVIDLSADFRIKDAATRTDIQHSDLIGNPGCYPTCTLLPLAPLIQAGMLQVDTIIVDAKSGVSGAGRSPSLGSHICEVGESFKAYKVAEHRHNPEIDEVLSGISGRPVHVTFVPHLVPMSRGMLTTIYADLADDVQGVTVIDTLTSFYQEHPFVRVFPAEQLPETRFVRGTNFCDIGCRFDERNRRIILICAIDNLIKGAAGQAVQNMNLMCGFQETAGLSQVPYPV